MAYGYFHLRNKQPIISNQITQWEILSSQLLKKWSFLKEIIKLKMILTKSKNNKPTTNITTLYKFIIKIH